MPRIILSLLIFSAVFLSACDRQDKSQTKAPEATPAVQEMAKAPEPELTPTDNSVISFTKKALYPEGIDYDHKANRYLVTSLREGVVSAVAADGTVSTFAQDPNMVSAIGIRIDADRDRVLVCNSDPGVSMHTKPETKGKLAGVAVFRLSTGKILKYIDLGGMSEGGHFCNDIVVDKMGTAYITDSFSPIIYKVDPGLNASIFLQNDRFKGEGFNLNGLVIKDDYLLVSKYNEGTLFKIPLKQPEKFTEINMKDKLVGADGLLWGADGSLVVVANLSTNKVFKLSSADAWGSAEVTASQDTGQVFATTAVLKDAEVHVLHAMLHVLFDPKTTEHIEKFNIGKYKI